MNTGPFKFEVTDRLRSVIELAHGDSAPAWLDSLPETVARYQSLWGLRLIGLPDSGAMSCCVFAELSDGASVVLKIPVEKEVGARECAVMELWAAGQAAPPILEFDARTGVFLMERVIPGQIAEPVGGVGDSRAVIALMDRLHVAASTTGLELGPASDTVEMRLEWAFERFGESQNGAGIELVTLAKDLMMKVRPVLHNRTIIHGDFQPKNILRSTSQGLCAIDPMACVGDPVLDASLWAVVQDGPVSVSTRINELASNGDFDLESLRDWCTVFAILELRPYSAKYTGRMVAYLESSDVSTRLARGELVSDLCRATMNAN